MAKENTFRAKDRQKFVRQAIAEAEKMYPELEKLKKLLPSSDKGNVEYVITYSAA